jgi:ATP-dependent helicase/nuclease subunit B
LDYKTSAGGKTCQEAHLASAREETPPPAVLDLGGKRKRWTDLQLPLYAHLWNGKPLKEASSLSVGYFLIPPAMDDTQVQVWDDFSDAMLASSLGCAESICQSVLKGLFWPPADRVMFEDIFRDAVGGELDAVFTPLSQGGAP